MAKVKTSMGRRYLPPDKYLITDEIKRLRQYLQAEANKAYHRGTTRALVNQMIVEVMLETGLRADEVCNLQLQDLPTHHKKDVVLVRRGKGSILRVVDVKESLKPKLQKFIKTCRKGAKPGSPLFASEKGYRMIHCKRYEKGKVIRYKEKSARLTYHSLYCKVRHIGKLAGIPHLHPHMFRHTFATYLHAIEHDLRYCQDAMGHSRPETTARYARVLDPDRRRQIERLYNERMRKQVEEFYL